MKNKVTEKSEERAEAKRMMQDEDLWENENEGQTQRGRCKSYVEEKVSWGVKTITQRDSQKHERRSEGHAATARAVTTSVIASKLKSGSGSSAGGSGTQRYVWTRKGWKRTERLLQHQREQDTTAFSPARERGAGGGGWQQEGAGRGAGERGRRGDAKPKGGRLPGRGNSGAPTLRGSWSTRVQLDPHVRWKCPTARQ